MPIDRMTVLSAMIDQGVIPVFYHPDVEVCTNVIQACANGGAKCIEFTNRGDFASHVFLDVTRHFAKADKSRPEDPLAALSPREMEVFSHLVNGLRAKDIADLLEISPKTVDTYRASLMRKLKVHDLVGLVKFAIERNLTTTSPLR